MFMDITNTIDKKIEALGCYPGELRPYPDKPNIEGIRREAETWGYRIGCKYVEPFEVIRLIA